MEIGLFQGKAGSFCLFPLHWALGEAIESLLSSVALYSLVGFLDTRPIGCRSWMFWRPVSGGSLKSWALYVGSNFFALKGTEHSLPFCVAGLRGGGCSWGKCVSDFTIYFAVGIFLLRSCSSGSWISFGGKCNPHAVYIWCVCGRKAVQEPPMSLFWLGLWSVFPLFVFSSNSFLNSL